MKSGFQIEKQVSVCTVHLAYETHKHISRIPLNYFTPYCDIYTDIDYFSGEERVYVVGSKSFRPDIQKPRQMENAVRDI